MRAVDAGTAGPAGSPATRCALFWYRNEPLQPFGHETPERFVAAGRTGHLLRYAVSLKAVPAG